MGSLKTGRTVHHSCKAWCLYIINNLQEREAGMYGTSFVGETLSPPSWGGESDAGELSCSIEDAMYSIGKRM